MRETKNISLHEIKLKWDALHTDPLLREKNLDVEVYESWQRDYTKHVSRFKKTFDNIASQTEYRAELDKSKNLLDCARPVMENLAVYLKNTGFLILLTNPDLMVMKILGEERALNWAKNVNLLEGTIWSEDLTGTNTGNLCMNLKKPASLFAYEHFCLSSITATSSGCPIMESGHILGGIGLVAPYTEFNNEYTLALMAFTAQQIQSSMFLTRMDKYQSVILESLSDGVLVVDPGANIVFINQKCMDILDFPDRNRFSRKNLHAELGNHPENLYFIDSITNERTFTDEIFVIFHGKQKIRCKVTCSPVHGLDEYQRGNVVILQKIEWSAQPAKTWIVRSARMTFPNIIGENPEFRRVLSMASSAAAMDSSILLLGESGTGKDVIAQAIHNESPRKNAPFIAINCAALPRELLASELFGYNEGAFTGAKKEGNIGKFEQANQGTIFLDEIGDMPLDLQVMLLRVIEERSITRLGDTKTIPINIRIISATNKDLEKEVQRNGFRLDLYYRLGVIKLKIPPLRARGQDILLLAEHYIREICRRYYKPPKRLSQEARQALLSYVWPGNVRELQNIIESLVLLSEGSDITRTDIREYLSTTQSDVLGYGVPVPEMEKDGAEKSLPDMEMRLLREHLAEGKHTKEDLMKLLGVSRRTLYRRLNALNGK